MALTGSRHGTFTRRQISLAKSDGHLPLFAVRPTLADAILDRAVHNSYRLALKGESMRKQKTVEAKTAAKPKDR